MGDFVVAQRVWAQCSSDYNAEPSTRTRVVKPETTVAEVMAWSKAVNVLGRGDLILTEQDFPTPATHGEG